jgi:hypothetical protein
MLLDIYLNDHLAASTGGRDLASRAASSNRNSEYGPFLKRLAREIAEDRESLVAIMRALDVKVDRLKVIAGWGAEKVGRLKLNGRLLGYSPLSRLVELEALALGVHGKLALWRSLQQLEPELPGIADGVLTELAGRAERQLEELEVYRRRATTEALLSD